MVRQGLAVPSTPRDGLLGAAADDESLERRTTGVQPGDSRGPRTGKPIHNVLLFGKFDADTFLLSNDMTDI